MSAEIIVGVGKPAKEDIPEGGFYLQHSEINLWQRKGGGVALVGGGPYLFNQGVHVGIVQPLEKPTHLGFSQAEIGDVFYCEDEERLSRKDGRIFILDKTGWKLVHDPTGLEEVAGDNEDEAPEGDETPTG